MRFGEMEVPDKPWVKTWFCEKCGRGGVFAVDEAVNPVDVNMLMARQHTIISPACQQFFPRSGSKAEKTPSPA